jgi:hypothetical protein
MTPDDKPLTGKLSAALRETARDIPATPPPLDLSRDRVNGGRAYRDHATGRWISWAAPLAAAAVVLAVVAGALAVTGHFSHHRTSPAADFSGVPAYYVALTIKGSHPDPANGDATAAEVRATATGAVLARITVPKPYAFFSGLTAAADDRTFVLVAEEKYIPPKKPQVYYPPSRFYLLRIAPEASSPAARVSLRALPAGYIPANNEVRDLALSPDGTVLAADVGLLSGSQLFVFDLATGNQRAWSFAKTCRSCSPSSGGLGLGGTNIDALSWTGDGRQLAFVGPGATSRSPSAVRLLDVSAPGTNLLTDSKPVFPWPGGASQAIVGPSWRGAIITPDGRTVVFLEQLVTFGPTGRLTSVRTLLAKGSAVTGKVAAVYGNLKPVGQYQQVMYTNATGGTLVVYYFGLGYGIHVGILRGNQFTPIPWNPHTVTAAW